MSNPENWNAGSNPALTTNLKLIIMQTIQKQFVTYEISLAMKELGFNEECLACYTPHLGKGIFELISKGTSNEKSGFNERFIKAEAINGCAAPLWQQVIDWFREERDIYIYIKPGFDNLSKPEIYQWEMKIRNRVFIKDGDFKSYEEAREQAILKAIEL